MRNIRNVKNATKMTLLAGLVLCLMGCVSLRAPIPAATFTKQTPAARAHTLSQLQHWQIDGALSITPAGHSSEIANYDWRQDQENYQITLSSSLNLYRITITKQGNAVSLIKNGTPLTEAPTAEKLLKRATGWSLPISALQYWIKGLPAPQAPFSAQYDAFGHLILLKQQGFFVRYQTYQTDNGLDFPQLLSVQNDTLFAKIVIKKWELS